MLIPERPPTVAMYITLHRVETQSPFETGACVFREPVMKEQSSELLDCVFKDDFSMKNVREVLLSPVSCMQIQTLLRAAAQEWVLMIACAETTKGRLCQGAWNIDLGI